MGCCESTPEAPDEILPNPQGECKFVTKSCSMFNSDYEVFRDFVDKKNRWLFLNKVGKRFSSEAKVQLENYIRGTNPEEKKEGQILWSVKYDENPEYKQEYDSDSSNDSDMSMTRFLDIFGGNQRHTVVLKWKMESKAKFIPGILGGANYTIKVKAKGTAEREVYYNRDMDGNRERQYKDDVEVKKITCKVYDEAGNVLDKFKCMGKSLNHGGSNLKWDCAAFKSECTGSWGSREALTVHTKPGADPSMALLMAHLVATEFSPSEILADFSPNFNEMRGMHYYDDYDSD
mmetsp:Transcript_4504/g.6079  ORF Transcript_4504/g.6079 Transcript_4504/m.6079 type:complete len:289 (+) Transcript_4504:142-1008(+)|eukprot:CAMPEP_0196594762 /NCGR_PEP_ID=MMETSP1081-20130531/79218_1 /TAXON_ID=36882 /ORGANISM="Pyramimonas amylifera, Strain CCMP720" /LENGTH=288 /DNA_ID=CAMNT_0041919115 /DNA_START=137 /DNA_END=1003 /DNA_ORIENTATION=+